MGTPTYAAVILESLLKNHNIKALVCQSDKKSGRSMQLKMPPTKALILNKKLDIPIFQDLNEDTIKSLQNIPCDMIIVAAFGRILSREVLDIAPCINLHASILPKFRGASPIQASILENEKYLQAKEHIFFFTFKKFYNVHYISPPPLTLPPPPLLLNPLTPAS